MPCAWEKYTVALDFDTEEYLPVEMHGCRKFELCRRMTKIGNRLLGRYRDDEHEWAFGEICMTAIRTV